MPLDCGDDPIFKICSALGTNGLPCRYAAKPFSARCFRSAGATLPCAITTCTPAQLRFEYNMYQIYIVQVADKIIVGDRVTRGHDTHVVLGHSSHDGPLESSTFDADPVLCHGVLSTLLIVQGPIV